MRAIGQQSELITRPSADGAASKEVSAAAAVAHISLHGGTQTAQQAAVGQDVALPTILATCDPVSRAASDMRPELKTKGFNRDPGP